MRYVSLALALVVILSAQSPAASACRLSDADRAWIESTLAAWDTASREILAIEPRPLPWVVYFDATCVWHVNPDARTLEKQTAGRAVVAGEVSARGRRVAVLGFEHGGEVRIPDGNAIPPRLATFAGNYGEGGRSFFVMAMPSVWRAEERHRDEPNLDALVRSVFVHEMSHTIQTPVFGPRIDGLVARHKLPDDLDDDIVQKRFADRSGFAEAVDRERTLLYRVAAEPDGKRRRALAAEAVAAIKERRARYFTGPDAVYAELEDIFLTMEGVANWAAYHVAARERLAGTDALTLIRGRRRWWSQDEGLAIFLALDALGTNWKAAVLGPHPPSIVDLLSKGSNVR